MSLDKVIRVRCTEAEKTAWTARAGSRTVSDYIRFLLDRDAEQDGQYVPLPMRKPVASQVEATRTAVAQLTPKQQKAAPVSVVGRGFGSPGDLSAGDVTTYFKSVPVPKKGRR